MARATHVKRARKDIPQYGIKKGDEYWHWSFMVGGRGGPKICSKTPPRRSQLTNSAFKSTLYEIQDNLGDKPEAEDMESRRDDIVGELENLRDETQGSLDNMPEGLQQGDTGQTLQTRIDSLEEVIQTLENIDCDPANKEDDTTLDDWRESVWQEITEAVDSVDEG